MARSASRPRLLAFAGTALWLTVAWFAAVEAVDKSLFKTCEQSGFCRRNRRLADQPPGPDASYAVVPGTVRLDESGAGRAVVGELTNAGHIYNFAFHLYDQKQFRLRINEKAPLSTRYEVPDVIVATPATASDAVLKPTSQGFVVTFGLLTAQIQASPFNVIVSEAGREIFRFNKRNFLNVEYLRTKEPPAETAPAEAELAADDASPEDTVQEVTASVPASTAEDGYWEETFKSHTDKKPYGPESVGMDIGLVGVNHVYGLPERSTPLNLPSTRAPHFIIGLVAPIIDQPAKSSSSLRGLIGRPPFFSGAGISSDPHRLYNLDVFEYDLDVTMSLYGSIPFVVGHAPGLSLGLLWLNGAETWIDVERFQEAQGPTTSMHWFSESGIIDAWGFVGTSPAEILTAYTALTGRPALPREFALAYHQCRWNYNDEADVAAVDAGFDQFDIPYDVLWLDIEHTDSKKYFTWDPIKFPNPREMQQKLSAKSRKMVTIVDPHIKHDNNYAVHTEAVAQSMYVKDDNNNNFEGWCWPGASSWVDFTDPKARQWWADRFSLANYKGSTQDLFIWNDMNEPSVFNGPEVSMHKHNMHHNGFEHRDVHNLYGFYQMMATAQGLRQRDNKRPFLLSRAFYAGSQRYGAIWTGDNKAEWSHLKASIPMLLTISMAGLPFVGADVGGFFGNPDAELLTRWYEGEPYTSHIRAAIRRRYTLLPYFYTLFHEASLTGAPVMRPLFYEFPTDTSLYEVQHSFMVGSALLVQPVAAAGVNTADVLLPGGATQVWYEYETWQRYTGGPSTRIDAPLGRTPVFMRGGQVIVRRDRVRRSSAIMHGDPITLVVALDQQGRATGRYYLDDGESYSHEAGNFVDKLVTYADGELTGRERFTNVAANQLQKHRDYMAEYPVYIERVILVGLPSRLKGAQTITSSGAGRDVEFLPTRTSDGVHVVHLKRPGIMAGYDWSIKLSF